MTIQYHPSETSLLEYASGRLNEAACLVIATHLAACAGCRDAVCQAEELGGAIFDALPATELSADALDHALSLVDRAEPVQPRPVVDSGIGDPAWLKTPLKYYQIGKWRWLAPGIHRARIFSRRRGGLDLLRVAPGKSVGMHGHRGVEFTCVLDGGFTDGFRQFGPGDFAEIDETIEHRPVADADGECICLIATEHRLKMRGLARLFQPFLDV